MKKSYFIRTAMPGCFARALTRLFTRRAGLRAARVVTDSFAKFPAANARASATIAGVSSTAARTSSIIARTLATVARASAMTARTLATVAGSSANGTVFCLSLPLPPPQLAILPYGPYVILTWPTNVAGFDYTGFTVQSTTNLVSPAVWSTNSPGPVVIGRQNVLINPITGPQQFYRLKQ